VIREGGVTGDEFVEIVQEVGPILQICSLAISHIM
jgi:hypothetical protein